MSHPSRPSPQQEADLVEPFARAIRDVFKKMSGFDPEVGRAFVNPKAAAISGVCGVIEFYGQAVGSVALRFGLDTARNLVTAFLGECPEPGTPDFADAVGELANMVAGSAKRNLNRTANISTPAVFLNGYAATHAGDVPCLVIPCRCEHGVFTVEISLRAAAAAA